MHPGRATAEGSRAFARRFTTASGNGFYREANGWRISSIGLGCSPGGTDEEAGSGGSKAVMDAFRGGINLFDVAGNPHPPHGEPILGAALRGLIRDGEARREEFIVCAKSGYPAPGAAASGAPGEDTASGVHSLHPGFLLDQVARSREALGFDSLDVCYLSNPETQLAETGRGVFLERVRQAFEAMELCADKGWVQAYGVATWDGFRRRDPADPGLQLAELAVVAREIAGNHHHFRFIQAPFNLGMVEAFTVTSQRVNGEPPRSILDIAADMGIHVIASAPLLQSRLTRGLPGLTKHLFPEAETDAQRALQFARSAPCVVSAVAGMRRPEHVAENLRVSLFAPVPASAYRRLF